MSQSQLNVETIHWTKIGRRWMTILFALLAVNFSLVLAGFRSHNNRPAITTQLDSATAGETDPTAVVADQSAPDNVAVEPGTAEPAPLNNPAPPGIVAQSSIAVSDTNTFAAAAATDPQPLKEDGVRELSAANSPPAPAAIAPVAITSSQTHPELDSPKPLAEVVMDDKGEWNEADTASPTVVIINPPTSGGIVHYMIGSGVYSLLPAEYHRFEGGQEQRVIFHRGDDRGDAECVVNTGVFVFGVGDAGWELTQPARESCRRLLRTCRPFDSKKK